MTKVCFLVEPAQLIKTPRIKSCLSEPRNPNKLEQTATIILLLYIMKESRAKFKKAFKYCRENEAQIKRDIVLEEFLGNGRNSKDFRREVRKSKNVVPNHPCANDGISDRNEMVNFFSYKYRNELDNPECQLPCDLEELHIVLTMHAIFLFMMYVMQWINLKLVKDGTEFTQTI